MTLFPQPASLLHPSLSITVHPFIQPEAWGPAQLSPLHHCAFSVTWSHQRCFSNVPAPPPPFHPLSYWCLNYVSIFPSSESSFSPPSHSSTSAPGSHHMLLCTFPRSPPAFQGFPAAFKIRFKPLSLTSAIHYQIISKHPLPVQAQVSFVLNIALKMPPLHFCCATQALSPWSSAAHLEVTLSSVPTVHFTLFLFDTVLSAGCHLSVLSHSQTVSSEQPRQCADTI